jgi:hypothetical protein
MCGYMLWISVWIYVYRSVWLVGLKHNTHVFGTPGCGRVPLSEQDAKARS